MSDHQNHDAGGPAQNLPIEFKFRDHPVRAFRDGSDIAVVANDACAALDLKNPNQVLTRLDDDEKGVRKVDTLGGPQQLAVVSLSGLVRLITRSNKPEARAFQRWLFHDVVPSIYETGRYEIGQKAASEDKTDPESEGYARDRLFKIYREGHLNPDDLLRALFGKNIPYTSSRKHPFFLTECCEALDISETAAAGRIPDTDITTIEIEAGEDRLERRAITEAALYFLAFSRQSLKQKQIDNENGDKIAVDWVHIPKSNVGRYILTILPDGHHHLYKTDYDRVLYEADQMHCLAICHSIKTVEALWLGCHQLLEFQSDLRDSHLMLTLDDTISNAAQHADQLIAVYAKLGPHDADSKTSPRPTGKPPRNRRFN